MPREPLILLLRPHPVDIGPLSEAGVVAAIPVLRIVPNEAAITEIAQSLHNCDWLVLTSPRAPSMLSRIKEAILRATSKGLRIAVVGPRTAEKLREEIGVEPDLIPRKYTGRVLAEELAKQNPGCVLLARSEKATRDLIEVLRDNGIAYIEVQLYSAEPLRELARAAATIADSFDYVVFTSPSVATTFFKEYGREPSFTPVAIGPTTARTLRSLGLGNVLIPDEYTLQGIAELISRHWARKTRNKH